MERKFECYKSVMSGIHGADGAVSENKELRKSLN